MANNIKNENENHILKPLPSAKLEKIIIDEITKKFQELRTIL